MEDRSASKRKRRSLVGGRSIWCLLCRDLRFDGGTLPALRVAGESRQSAPAGHVRCRSETARAPGRRETRRRAAPYQGVHSTALILQSSAQDRSKWSKSRKKALPREINVTASVRAASEPAPKLAMLARRCCSKIWVQMLVLVSLFPFGCLSSSGGQGHS